MLARAAKHLAQRRPEPEGTVSDSQFRGAGEATALEIEQQLAPALRALAITIGEAQNLLTAPFICADQDQNALLFLGHAWPEIYAIGPDIDDPPGPEIAALPAVIFVPSRSLEPRDGGRRQPRRVRPQERGQRFLEIAAGNALEVEPGQ